MKICNKIHLGRRPENMILWIPRGRPGYLGKRRNDQFAKWNEIYGSRNWRLVWSFGGAVLDFLGVCAVYEDAYFEFLKNNNEILCQLTHEASDAFDDSSSNMRSGFNYLKQETGRTHIQDIAIRRCVARLGTWFSGKDPIRIRDNRGSHSLSLILSPGQVPFHRPELINCNPELTGWWKSKSVESFYQSNRLLLVKNIFQAGNRVRFKPGEVGPGRQYSDDLTRSILSRMDEKAVYVVSGINSNCDVYLEGYGEILFNKNLFRKVGR
jgi:hypothetical protein